MTQMRKALLLPFNLAVASATRVAAIGRRDVPVRSSWDSALRAKAICRAPGNSTAAVTK
jgi:hypothetical protein